MFTCHAECLDVSSAGDGVFGWVGVLNFEEDRVDALLVFCGVIMNWSKRLFLINMLDYIRFWVDEKLNVWRDVGSCPFLLTNWYCFHQRFSINII